MNSLDVTPQDQMRTWLGDNNHPNIEEVMQVLQPYYEIAEAGKYSFVPSEEIDQEALMSSVSNLTGRAVKKITFISLKNPFPKPEWMTPEVYRGSLRTSLGDSLGGSLGDSLRDSLWNSLRTSLGGSLGGSLRDSLRDSLWNSLGGSLGDSFRDSLWNSFRDSLWVSLVDSFGDSLWVSLFYYIGFSLVGENDKADNLEVLLGQMIKCLPVGFKKDEPETLLVLVK